MRTIQFRAWHKVRKEMYDVYSLSRDFVFKDTMDGVGCDGVPDKREDVVLMQFTGLHDKNGKPIFEGDTFQNFPYPNGFSGIIEWDEDKLQWMCLYNTSKLIPLCERAAHIKIIGHIHQTEEQ